MTIDIYTMSYQDLLTVAGAATLCAIFTQWLKQYLADWRWTNLLALAITIAFCEAAMVLSGPATGERAFDALITAIAGASLATFGYETIVNLLGMVGVGPRK
jgi:glucan phosphoethanolaminetransferase (alkaline phosphatase superfamily)